ncbi:hypothetical protein OQA88_467 [Cercophora sp. LCS_1]
MSEPPPPQLPPNVVVFGPKANCTLEICPLEMSVYGYLPSLAANISFIAVYALAAAIHTYLGFRWKQRWFMVCMLLGVCNAIIGYIGRVLMHYNPFNFAAFMLQIAIYITLALSINHFSPKLSRFNPNLFYWIFIPCDLISLILQAAGGGLSTSSAGSSQVGVDLALAGLSFQVFTIVMFCAFFGDYLWRYFRSDTWRNDVKNRIEQPTRLKLFFGFMAAAVLLILARCTYRLAELHEGYRGGLVRDEPLFIALEGVMIIAAVYCLMIGHPGFVFGSGRERRNLGHGEQEVQEYNGNVKPQA